MLHVLLNLYVCCVAKFCMVLLLQVRAGSRALYRPLSASVLSRPEIKTEVRRNLSFLLGLQLSVCHLLCCFELILSNWYQNAYHKCLYPNVLYC